jgi:hypothetical protein
MDQLTVRKFLIPTLWLFAIVMVVALLELCSGTDLYFVSMMTVTLLSAGITYNLLGGLGSASGILFAFFALRNIVISQLAKALLFESATLNLEAPSLTITVYAVFYFCVMVGVFIWGRMRIRLPQPSEPDAGFSSTVLYFVSLILGTLGLILIEATNTGYGGAQSSSTPEHSLGAALEPLLLFAMVVAVDLRIRRTEGRHSFGIADLIPCVVAIADAFADTARTGMIMPIAVYFVACHLRSYRFRLRHYAFGVVGIAVFSLLVSPMALYARNYLNGQSFSQRAYIAYSVATSHNPMELAALVSNKMEGDYREQYFSRPGTFTLSRLSLIRADSTLINACSNGYHYGMAQVKEEIEREMPSFLVKHKYLPHENNFIANVSGLGTNTTSQPIFTAISDSYGMYGWIGVLTVALIGFPAVFVLYDNMFDISKPWGTVALGAALALFGEMSVSRFLVVLVREPILIIGFSYAIAFFIGFIPAAGDRRVSMPAFLES